MFLPSVIRTSVPLPFPSSGVSSEISSIRLGGVQGRVKWAVLACVPCVLGCSASWIHSTGHPLSLPFLWNHRSEPVGLCMWWTSRDCSVSNTFVQSSISHWRSPHKLRVVIIFTIATLKEFIAGQLFVGCFCWIWERNAVTKDWWPSEGSCHNNLSHSPPLIKDDIPLVCFLWEALDVSGYLSNRKAIFSAFVHERVLMSKLITKRSHVYAKWHGRRSETVGLTGLTGSVFLMAPGK